MTKRTATPSWKTLCLLLALAGTAGPALAEGEAAAQPGRLTVTAEGTVAAEPDMAVVTLGVLADNPDAEVAIRDMTAGIDAVMARIKSVGIAPRDIQTTGLTLSPRWREQRDDPGKAPEIESFVASVEVTVRVRELGQLGPLLDQVVKSGANTFRGLDFALQEPQPVEDAARRAAVAEARRRAELYAAAAGVTLGPILTIDELGGVSPKMFRAEFAAAAAADGGIPVAAGELSVSANVAITWSLLPAE